MRRERDRELAEVRDELAAALASFHGTRTAVVESLKSERDSLTSDPPGADPDEAPPSWLRH